MTDLEIFHNAPENLSTEELSDYLDQACGDDAPLRTKVESLFAMETKPKEEDFLSQIAVPGMGQSPLEASLQWEPPSVARLQEMLPQYKITGIAGRGGMGAVYRGRQVKLGRDVAIKILPETLKSEDDKLEFSKRFEQEARAMANLDHPAIVAVYDFGETEDGQLYFVMEFIDGMDIHQYLAFHGGTLEQAHAVAITAHVLDALDYAHAHGIIHRDIKPANVLLNNEGRVKIADFGLAKKLEGTGLNTPLDSMVGAVTMTNVAIGTPDFVAPESIDSDKITDHRADLYSVGVMLYQMLTGKIPRGNFKAPSKLRPELDPILDNVVERLLEPDPDDRYNNASEVRWALDPASTQPVPRIDPSLEDTARQVVVAPEVAVIPSDVAPTVAPQPKSRFSPVLIGSITAFLLLAIAGGGYLLWRSQQQETNPVLDLSNADLGRVEEPPPLPADETAPVSVPDAKPKEETAPVPAMTLTEIETPEEKPAPKTAPPLVAGLPEKDDPSPALAKAPPNKPDPSLAEMAEDEQPDTKPGKKKNPLATLPGLESRLKTYLKLRREAVDKLAKQYLRGVDNRLQRAANGGNLRLANAYRQEKQSIATLQEKLANPPSENLLATVEETVLLPPLNEKTPQGLAGLRKTWNTERQKIRKDLDGKLEQSLMALEADLTRRRDFEKANALLAWRESLALGKAKSPGEVQPKALSLTETSMGQRPHPELTAATKEEPFENTLGMKFVPVPDTEVLFCIHEVRQKDYAAFAGENPDVNPKWKNQKYDNCIIQDRAEEHPAAGIGYHDAIRFCAWLSEKEGKVYRLPADREWSYAAGVGKRERWRNDTTPMTVEPVEGVYPWGREWPPPQGVGNFSDLSRKKKLVSSPNSFLEDYDDGYPTTAPVMSFSPNEFGLFDLAGNVWEWVSEVIDAETGINRGLSYASSPDNETALSSRRARADVGRRYGGDGFRVVVQIAGVPEKQSVKLTSRPEPPAPIGEDAAIDKPLPFTPVPPPTKTTKDKSLATRNLPFKNSIGMRFVPVEDTDVLFCIHEVRYDDFAVFARETKAKSSQWKNQTLMNHKISERSGEHPVVSVNWDEAAAFCEWLSKKEGKRYRLPTDEEWSQAVGLGRLEKRKRNTTPSELHLAARDVYPWGEAWPPPAGSGNFSDLTTRDTLSHGALISQYRHWENFENYRDGYATTAPVMSFLPNEFGLYDLAGNVSEWVQDWWDEEKPFRVARGSNWARNGLTCFLSSNRAQAGPGYESKIGPKRRDLATGFRIVVERSDENASKAVNPANDPAGQPQPGKAAVPQPTIENSLGMKFVPMPETDVLFCIHETRRQDYAAYAAENPGISRNWENLTHAGYTLPDPVDLHPVQGMTRADAIAFCKWLSRKEEKTYRLPTDREWSIAVGLADHEPWEEGKFTPSVMPEIANVFPWGTEWPATRIVGNLSDRSRREKAPQAQGSTNYVEFDDGYPTTAPVMSFPPNAFGLYDLEGNVREIVSDFWNEQEKLTVTRGGSYGMGGLHNSLSARRNRAPAGRTWGVDGFRIVLEAD